MGTDKARAAIFFGQYAAILLYALFWVHLSHVRDRVVSLPLFYTLIGIALCYVAVRAYVVMAKEISNRRHAVWVAADLIIITAVVRLTGGIHSEAALVYFWPIATYSIQRRPHGAMLVGLATAVLYVAATWPADFTVDYAGRMGTRLFVLVLVTVLAACYALAEVKRVEEIARLREKLGLAEYRARLSQEMHDGIQRYLVSIGMRLEMAGKLADTEPARAAAIAVDQGVSVRQAADELRYLVRRLRSPLVEQQGFVDALRDHLSVFAERLSVSGPVEIEGTPVPLPPHVEQAAFRIVQEALTNIEKHAEADQVSVTLRFEAHLLQCVIADNGAGFEPAALPDHPGIDGGFGISSMRQRAEAVGGELRITSAPGQGTELTFTVPISDENTSGG